MIGNLRGWQRITCAPAARSMPWADVEIWDEHNQPVPLGQPGQIVARTDGQMTGFWNDPEGTKERMVDGWVLTGDIGMIDRNGYLYLLDRADDMIISGGFNIWPMELENAIADASGGDGGGGVRHPRPALGRDALRRRGAEARPARRRGGGDPALRRPARLLQEAGPVVVRDEPLPKTPVGKIKRRDLREPYWAGHTRRVAGS